MKLKELDKPSAQAAIQKLTTSKRALTLFIIALSLVLYSVLIFFVGLLSAENRYIDPNTVISSSSKLFTVVSNKANGLFSTPDRLYLDIEHKHFQKLAYKRDVALTMGRLITTDEDFVPATIRKEDQSIPVKVRLKGDWTDHLQGEKWSYRVKVKGDAALYGMQEFSIQHPKTRNYLPEWVYHEALKREGVISLRYDFVELIVNGKNLGIFALEEHFNATLIEHNQRRAGPIIRLSEEQAWEQLDEIVRFPESFPSSSATFNAAYIDAFESKKIASDSVYQQQFIRAISLFEALRTGTRPTRDVFDIDKLASYLAVTELLGAHHSAIWNHMRFYYNPVTGKLEPIGFDGNAGNPLPIVTITMDEFDVFENWRREMFYSVRLDPAFDEAYSNALHRVSRPAYLDNLMKELQPEFNRKLRILHKSYPNYEFPFGVLERNRQHIYHVINPTDGLRVHFKEQREDTLILQVGSTQSLPAQLKGFRLSSGQEISLSAVPTLPGRKIHESITFQEIQFALPDTVTVTDSTLALFQTSYKIPGVDSLLYVPVVPYPQSSENLIQHELIGDDPTDQTFAFLSRNDQLNTVTAQQGTWSINRNLIIPEGYSLHVPSGTTFDLTQGAAVVVRGTVHFEGTARSPIRMISTDSTGQGLLVLNADTLSVLTHAEFLGMNNLNQSGWTQTGSLTFHESPVFLSNVTFRENQSEDALNIIRSTFRMDSVLFTHIYSDAFDGDFTDGTITNSIFEHLGNDGIDVSGSTLSFENVHIAGAGDKALSAGEFSEIEGKDLNITDSEIAIASKDNSVVTLNRVHISNSRLGVALFQKKPEFGPASLEANDYVIQNTDVPSLIEEGSLFMVNGERIPANKKNVSDLLYGNLYGTASN